MEQKKKFLTQLILFVISSVVAPIVYLYVRFSELFKVKTVRTIPFIAVLCVILVLAVVGVMIWYYISGLKTKYSLVKQVLEGILKVILPLAIITAIAVFLKQLLTTNTELFITNCDKFISSMIVIIVFELIAVVVNPLPKWAFENNIDGFAGVVNKILGGKDIKIEDKKEGAE